MEGLEKLVKLDTINLSQNQIKKVRITRLAFLFDVCRLD